MKGYNGKGKNLTGNETNEREIKRINGKRKKVRKMKRLNLMN